LHLDFAGSGVFDRLFGKTEFARGNEFGYKHKEEIEKSRIQECGWHAVILTSTNIVKWIGMLNFREFEAGPDPFGRKIQVFFKWLQTAISLRHADTVDVRFVLVEPDGNRSQKTIALPHADLCQVSRDLKRPFDDPWCSRIAAMHLCHLIETGEDMEKDLVTVSASDLARYAASLAESERTAIATR
jgi:hypothetical protein